MYSVKTIERVAAELGETVYRIFDFAIDMETEDGVIWVYGPGDDSVIAFTPCGIENVQELIEMDRDRAVAYAGCLPYASLAGESSMTSGQLKSWHLELLAACLAAALAQSKAEAAELAQLRRDNKRLKEENEMMRKATAPHPPFEPAV